MRIDGIIFEQIVNSDNISDLFSRLNIGDVIKGRILDITSGNLLIKLLDGSTFKALPPANFNVQPGGQLTLLIKSKDAGQIVLELLNSENKVTTGSDTTDSELENLLVSTGIKADRDNLDIARELKAFKMPLDKDTIELIADSVKTLENITVEKAAYLIANKMALNENNIGTLTHLVDGNFKISASLENLFNLIEGAKNTPFYETLENELYIYELFNNIKDLLTNSSAESLSKEIFTVQDIFKFDMQTGVRLVNNYSPEEFKALLEPFLNNHIEGFENLSANEKTAIIDSIYAALKKSANIDYADNIDKDRSAQESTLGQLQKEAGYFQGGKSGNSIRKAFEQTRINLDSKNLSKDLNIKNLYREILEKFDIIKSKIAEHQNIPGKEQMIKILNDTENNIRFMNELCSHSTYIQLPINIWNKNTTGELYILKRNPRKRKTNIDDVTVFISLDTYNLGCIDTLLGVKKKNVSLNISAESPEIAGFVKENYKMLYDSLFSKGYRLVDMKCKVRDTDKNLLKLHKDMIVENDNTSRSRLDFRV